MALETMKLPETEKILLIQFYRQTTQMLTINKLGSN